MNQPPLTVLRQLRHQAGVSIRELEKRTGINRGRLSDIERGIPPEPAEIQKIMAALAAEKGDAA